MKDENMKKLLFLSLAVLIMATGCIVGIPTANRPPIAYIDSLSPATVFPGEAVTFAGHGTDPDGSVVAYQWRSSIDGELSTMESFEDSSLSEGAHTIYFKVQDDSGDWSEETDRHVTVLPAGIVEPVINDFSAGPRSIFEGKTSTLSWDVTESVEVSIAPDIGDVGLNGTIVVTPAVTTQYTLTATNEIGKVIAKTEVIVVPKGLHTIELFTIAIEDGCVDKNGKVGSEPNVGDTASNVATQAFLSFDISLIPAGAIIKSASLDLSTGNEYGSPFATLGVMGVFAHQYGELSGDDFTSCPPQETRNLETMVERFPMTEAVYTTSSAPIEPFDNSRLIDAIQKQANTGSSRFQLRVQFEKYHFYNNEADYFALFRGKSKLVIEYKN